MIRKVLMDLKKEMKNLPPNTMINMRSLINKKQNITRKNI